MSGLPPTLTKVIESFSKFPGIGNKTAHCFEILVHTGLTDELFYCQFRAI
jgi:recombinational DNA repair protein RecR